MLDLARPASLGALLPCYEIRNRFQTGCQINFPQRHTQQTFDIYFRSGRSIPDWKRYFIISCEPKKMMNPTGLK